MPDIKKLADLKRHLQPGVKIRCVLSCREVRPNPEILTVTVNNTVGIQCSGWKDGQKRFFVDWHKTAEYKFLPNGWQYWLVSTGGEDKGQHILWSEYEYVTEEENKTHVPAQA